MEILGIFLLIVLVLALLGALRPARSWQQDRFEPGSRWRATELSWSLDLLRALEWKRFELVCAAYFQAQGLRTKVAREGADGGVDIHLYREDATRPTAIAQCKAWNTYKVGIKPVRELYGVMAREGVAKGVLLTTGRFTKEAQAFPNGDDLYLWDGEQVLAKLRALPAEKQAELLRLATEGDFTTPTCPSCGIKMVERTARVSGDTFWGCLNYPRCKQTFKMRD
jgi:restriction system protein